MSARCVDCVNEAIERCEVTGVTLCAEHLWYVDDGRRVSERVAGQLRASGHTVHAPWRYLQQLGVEYPPPRLPRPAALRLRVLPNGYDLLGAASALLCLVSPAAAWQAANGTGAAWLLFLPMHLGVAAAALRWAGRAVHGSDVRLAGRVGAGVAAACLVGVLGLALVAPLW